VSGVSPSRSYSGPAFDTTYQHISERPVLEDEADEVVYATDPEPTGEEQTENVPTPSDSPEPPDVDGQSTWDDWRWSP